MHTRPPKNATNYSLVDWISNSVTRTGRPDTRASLLLLALDVPCHRPETVQLRLQTQHVTCILLPLPSPQGDFVDVGLIGRAQGIKGEVRVYPITDEPKKRLAKAGVRLWLQPPNTGGGGRGGVAPAGGQMLQRVLIQHGRIVKPATNQDREVWAVKFNEVPDRTQVGGKGQKGVLLYKVGEAGENQCKQD